MNVVFKDEDRADVKKKVKEVQDYNQANESSLLVMQNYRKLMRQEKEQTTEDII